MRLTSRPPGQCLVVACALLVASLASSPALGECTLGCSASVRTSADAGEEIWFSASSSPSGCAGPVTHDWDFGDGSAHSAEQWTTHVFTGGGSFTWTLTATAGGTTCVKTGTISVCGLECSANVPATGRAGAPITFLGSANATSCLSWNRYDWDFGDGSSHGDWASPQHAYANPGTYTWILTVDNFTQSCTTSGTITIGEAIACSDCAVTVPATGEVGRDVTVESHMLPADCAGSPSYLFDFGDGFVAYWGTGSHRYCRTGTYAWRATATVGGYTCVKTGSIVITTPTIVSCSVNSTLSGACPLTASFTAYTSGCESESTYEWDFGGGVTSTRRETSQTYSHQGAFDWTMTTKLAGVPCTVTGTVTVNKPASITATAAATPRAGAAPLPVTFAGGSEPASCINAASYLWDFGDGATSTERNPTHLYAADGLHTWVLTVTSEGLTARRRGPVVVGPVAQTYTWAPQVSRRTDIIGDTDFPTELAGWTAGRDGLRSTGDGGRLWSDSHDSTCYAVHFLDASTGFYTAYCGFAWTSNGGAAWNVGFWYSNCYGFSLTDIFATSPTQVWQSDTAGDLWRWTYTPGTGYFGHDWTQDRYFSTGASHLQALYFTDPDNGWGIGNSGRIIRITNATSASPGFSTQPSGTSASLRSIIMLSPTQGWVVGAGGTILRTTNGGATWTPVAAGTPLDLWSVDFRDAGTGWIVGEGGVILATVDGGDTWSPEASPADAELRSVSAPPGSRVFAAGTGGTVLKRLPFACPEITITPDELPDGVAHTLYEQAIQGLGGDAPYTFGVSAGTPPDGLALTSSGVLSGYPSAAGVSAFTARAVDAGFCSGDHAYALAVSCDLTCHASAYFDVLVSPSLTAAFYSSTTGSCGTGTTFWTFGDGATSTDSNPAHAYASPGTYPWTLTITAGGQTCSKSGEITVAATCTVACEASAPDTAQPWSAVPFQATATASDCAAPAAFDWDFGDGSAHSSAQSSTHAYAAPGTYTWTLTAVSGIRSCSRSGTIEVCFNKRRHLRPGSGTGS